MAIRDTITEISKRLFGSLGDAALDGGFDVVRKVIDDTSSEREEIQKLRDYYDGYQIRGRGLQKGKKYVSLWPGEDDADLDTRADRMEQISWNRIRDGVNTHADALYAWGKGRAVSRDIVWDDSEVESEEDRAWWEEFYRKRFLEINNFPRLAWEVWNKAGAERHALGMLRWMDGSSRRLEKFTRDALDRATHRERGVVWVEILDPLHYVALPHPDQTSTLGAVIRWYLDPEYEWGRQISSNLVPTPGQDNTITELVTDRLWLRWKGRALTPHQWGMTNRYGDVRTLFVLAKNPGMVADSEDALKAQTSLNEHLYSGSEIKRQHAFPETLYRGYEPPMREDSQGNKVLDRGPNVAHVAADASADIIKASPRTGLQDIGMAESSIHQMLDDALGISQFDRGETEGMGQMRSAPAIARMQARSERRRRRKIMYAHEWEQDVFRSFLEMTLYHAFAEPDRGAYRDLGLRVTWPDDAFMMDPSTEAMKDALEIQAGMDTRENKLRKRHPDASDEQLDAMLDDIEASSVDSDVSEPQDVAMTTPTEQSNLQGQ
jgi:hypothetical protein